MPIQFHWRDFLPSVAAVQSALTSLFTVMILIPLSGISLWTVYFHALMVLQVTWNLTFNFFIPFLACFFATLVFTTRNPMHSLLSLVGVFFSTVIFYLQCGIEFIGLVFLIVYVGAVAVLFLFVIMLLNVNSLTATERLVRYITQLVAIGGGAVLAAHLKARVLDTAGFKLLHEHAVNARLTNTTTDAVAFYVRYQAADINALTPLYTQHAPLFMVITAILLVALLGAIIMATMTTERPTFASDVRLAGIRVIQSQGDTLQLFVVVTSAFCVTAGGWDVLDVSLCAVPPIFKRLSRKLKPISRKLKSIAKRLKRLVVRIAKRVYAELTWKRPTNPYPSKIPGVFSPHETWELKYTELIFDRKKEQILDVFYLPETSYSLRSLGLLGYFWFWYNTRVVPIMHYRATLASLYAPIFLNRLILILFVCVPFPWFLDDYDVAWEDLVNLYKSTMRRVTLRLLSESDPAFKTVAAPVLTLILLYPRAMVNVALTDFWPVMWITFFYVKDQFGYNHGYFGRCHRSEAACNFALMLAYDLARNERRLAAEIARPWRQRHPDKGRTDVFPYLWLTPAIEKLPGGRDPNYYEELVYALRPEFLHWPRHLCQLLFIFILVIFIINCSRLILVYTTRKLHGKQRARTRWLRALVNAVCAVASFIALAAICDGALYMSELHTFLESQSRMLLNPAQIIKVTKGLTSSPTVFFYIRLLFIGGCIAFWAHMRREMVFDVREEAGLGRRAFSAMKYSDAIEISLPAYLRVIGYVSEEEKKMVQYAEEQKKKAALAEDEEKKKS